MARPDEVEEFLRRAAARRAQAQGKRPRPPQQPAFNPPPPPKFRPPEPQLVEAEVVDAELADTNRVGGLVARDLSGTEQIAAQVKQLGAEVDLADDKMEAHLQQVFEHQVGRLKNRTAAAAAPLAEITSSDLAQMLKSPAQMRNAIVLSEILRRPEERW
ncbi:MAG: hypothetical protein SFU86_23725 [Pirellulaceae bacterium]|nr:hypothetical protein [Pirellulaceae bacterium]